MEGFSYKTAFTPRISTFGDMVDWSRDNLGEEGVDWKALLFTETSHVSIVYFRTRNLKLLFDMKFSSWERLFSNEKDAEEYWYQTVHDLANQMIGNKDE